MNCFKFLILLIIFDQIFSSVHSLSQHLQNKKVNLAKAIDLVSATTQVLETFRQEKEWEHLCDYAVTVGNSKGINVEVSSQRRQRQLPSRFSDGVVMETTGHRHPSSDIDNLRVSVYYPVLAGFAYFRDKEKV